jgi:hypothetical protein
MSLVMMDPAPVTATFPIRMPSDYLAARADPNVPLTLIPSRLSGGAFIGISAAAKP